MSSASEQNGKPFIFEELTETAMLQYVMQLLEDEYQEERELL